MLNANGQWSDKNLDSSEKISWAERRVCAPIHKASSVYAAWKAGTGEPTSDADRTPRIWAQAAYQF